MQIIFELKFILKNFHIENTYPNNKHIVRATIKHNNPSMIDTKITKTWLYFE